jgi:oxaloacetate decarboxylase gamma subunit
MTISEMLGQSAILTVLGMAVVFAFLWFMIICVNMAAKLVHKTGWDKDVRQSLNTPLPPKKTGGAAGPEITAAITAAVTEYREQEKGRHE